MFVFRVVTMKIERMIKNTMLDEREVQWLSHLLSGDFPGKQDVIDQINCANVSREYTDYFFVLKFKADSSAKRIDINVRVPVEMRVRRAGKAPVQFLLHIVDGFVDELEIFHADSSKMGELDFFEGAEVEIIYN